MTFLNRLRLELCFINRKETRTSDIGFVIYEQLTLLLSCSFTVYAACASIEDENRVPCAWENITKVDCEQMGCCYNGSVCFKLDERSNSGKSRVLHNFPDSHILLGTSTALTIDRSCSGVSRLRSLIGNWSASNQLLVLTLRKRHAIPTPIWTI